MEFSNFKTHSAPLFVSSRIRPIKMLYCKSVAFSCSLDFFRLKQIHSHFTRFSAAGNYFVKQSRIIISSFPSNGIPIELSELRETPFKQELSKVSLQILQNEEINVDMHYIGISKYLSLFNYHLFVKVLFSYFTLVLFTRSTVQCQCLATSVMFTLCVMYNTLV